MPSPKAGPAAIWSAVSTCAQKVAGWSSAGSSAIHATVRSWAVRDESHCATRDVLPKPAGAEMSVNLARAPRSSRAASLGRATRSGRGLGRCSLVATRGLGSGSSLRASRPEVIFSEQRRGHRRTSGPTRSSSPPLAPRPGPGGQGQGQGLVRWGRRMPTGSGKRSRWGCFSPRSRAADVTTRWQVRLSWEAPPATSACWTEFGHGRMAAAPGGQPPSATTRRAGYPRLIAVPSPAVGGRNHHLSHITW